MTTILLIIWQTFMMFVCYKIGYYTGKRDAYIDAREMLSHFTRSDTPTMDVSPRACGLPNPHTGKHRPFACNQSKL